MKTKKSIFHCLVWGERVRKGNRMDRVFLLSAFFSLPNWEENGGEKWH